jgi:rubrerythrin
MRYEYSAKTAKKEGYEQIANIFVETALNEKEHAKVFFRHLLKNGMEALPVNIWPLSQLAGARPKTPP